MTEIPARSGRIPALDGLRGCAIILVVLFHSNVWFGGEFGGAGGPVSIAFGAGWIGVDLFFVLSGFLITRNLLEAKDRKIRREYFSNFYAKRVLRIFPLYYGFIAFYLLLPPSPVVGNDSYRIPAIGTASLLLFFYNFLSAFGHLAIPTLHSFWSLCVEEHFYLFWPCLVWLLPERALARLSLAVVALSLGARLAFLRFGPSLEIAYLITPCRLDGLGLGAFVAVAERHDGLRTAVRRWAGPACAIGGAIFLLLGFAQGHFKDNVDFRFSHPPVRHDSSLIIGPGITAAVIFFGGTLVAVVRGGALSRALEWSVLRSIGRYSYAMYVFHRLLFHISSFYLVKVLPGYDRVPPLLGKPLGGLWLLGISYLAGWLSFHLYERHFLALKRRFS